MPTSVSLAASAAGKTLVPIPAFFSRGQIPHLIADAGIAHILTDARHQALVQAMGCPSSLIPRRDGSHIPKIAGACRIIYTSGSTGTPKGVRLGGSQVTHSVEALARASAAAETDLHLSILPLPLLLEQICGIYSVIRAGAACHIAVDAAARCAQGDPGALIEACEAVRPTTSVLTPELLSALAMSYTALGRSAPASLRFVAAGGAPVPRRVLEASWRVGIPACVGYGLSECCSVVTLTSPGDRRYAAGKPLPGVAVAIEDGEIVVSGPTVMQGYLGGADVGGRWRTGDIGRLDADGDLIVLGRKDNLLVLPNGRNVSPEWVEAMIEREPRVGRCIVFRDAHGALSAVVTPGAGVDADMASADFPAAALIQRATHTAPAYARPLACVTTTEAVLKANGLLNGKGAPRRTALAAYFNAQSHPRHTIGAPPESLPQ